MRRPVLARLAQEVGDASVRENRESLEAERWPRTVAAQPFEALAVAGLDGDPGVDIEPVHLGGPWALRDAAMVVLDVVRGLPDGQEGPAEQRELHARFERREKAPVHEVRAVIAGGVTNIRRACRR